MNSGRAEKDLFAKFHSIKTRRELWNGALNRDECGVMHKLARLSRIGEGGRAHLGSCFHIISTLIEVVENKIYFFK